MSEEKLAVNWYDRNPIPIANHFTVIKAPHASTLRLTYTCPKDKMAFIEILQLMIVRTTVAANPGLCGDWWFYTPYQKTGKRILEVAFVSKEIGNDSYDSKVRSMMLFPGDKLESYSWDLSPDGEVYHCNSYCGVTFDPYPIEFPLFPHELPKPDLQQPEKPWWWPL